MFLKQLHIVNFKNHEKKDFTFEKKLVGFTGMNGVGKTNILDAIYSCAFTKSYFSSSERNCIRNDEDFYRIEAKIEKNNEVFDIAYAYPKGKKKILEVNKVPYKRLSEHIGKFPIVIVAPDDNVLILGGSEERRKFIDPIIAQTDTVYLSSLSAVQKIMSQRNAILKDKNINSALLDVYDQQLIEPSNYIHQKRKDFIKELTPFLIDCYKALSGDKESIALNYKSQLNDTSIESLLKENRKKDIVLHRTTQGIHRDDLEFMMKGDKIKQFGSQGQQKTFLLSLKLTQHHYLHKVLKMSPLFLIDDMFDKLDSVRGSKAVEYICDNLNQVFITHTEREILEDALGKNQIEIFEIE